MPTQGTIQRKREGRCDVVYQPTVRRERRNPGRAAWRAIKWAARQALESGIRGLGAAIAGAAVAYVLRWWAGL